MSEVTAAQILSHCKAVCEAKDYSRCQVSRVSLRDPEAGYYITRLGWGVSVDANSPRHKIEQAATLLGLDLPSPAPVVLEWVDSPYFNGEAGERVIISRAKFNDNIEAYIVYGHGGYVGGGITITVPKELKAAYERMEIMKIPEVFIDPAQARAWCEAQIQKITTPTK